jgi:hypothetical protein
VVAAGEIAALMYAFMRVTPIRLLRFVTVIAA